VYLVFDGDTIWVWAALSMFQMAFLCPSSSQSDYPIILANAYCTNPLSVVTAPFDTSNNIQ
jgi:hypothetical protein